MLLSKTWVKIVLILITINAIIGALGYSFIGDTNNQGDFVISRTHQIIYCLVALALVAITIKSLRTKK